MSKLRIGVIGAGKIAREHIKVIKKIKDFSIVGITSRTTKKAKKIADEFGIQKVFDNIDQLMTIPNLNGIMILVSADNIFKVTKKLIPFRVPIFLEKPPGLSATETKVLLNLSKKYKTKNMVGLNRRFYSVFHKGLDIIKKKGKLLGVFIEGHERFWLLKKQKQRSILNKWLFANSIHTIDLLPFFGGKIKYVSKFKNSFKERKGDQFSCITKFENGAIGTYISNWYSPGGWSIKLFGEKVTVEFNPLEKASWIDSKFRRTKIVADSVDKKYKPGFYKQMIFFKKLLKEKKLIWPAQSLKEVFNSVSLVRKLSI